MGKNNTYTDFDEFEEDEKIFGNTKLQAKKYFSLKCSLKPYVQTL